MKIKKTTKKREKKRRILYKTNGGLFFIAKSLAKEKLIRKQAEKDPEESKKERENFI